MVTMAFSEPGDAVEAVGLEGFDQRYGRQDSGEPARSPRRPRFRGIQLDHGSDGAIRAQEVCSLTAADMRHSLLWNQPIRRRYVHEELRQGALTRMHIREAGAFRYPWWRISSTRPTREPRSRARPWRSVMAHASRRPDHGMEGDAVASRHRISLSV